MYLPEGLGPHVELICWVLPPGLSRGPLELCCRHHTRQRPRARGLREGIGQDEAASVVTLGPLFVRRARWAISVVEGPRGPLGHHAGSETTALQRPPPPYPAQSTFLWTSLLGLPMGLPTMWTRHPVWGTASVEDLGTRRPVPKNTPRLPTPHPNPIQFQA